MNWENTLLIGETLKEFDMLGFPEVNQAYYVECHRCVAYYQADKNARKIRDRRAMDIDKSHEEYFEEQCRAENQEEDIDRREDSISDIESMTEGPTLDNSALSTPPPAEEQKPMSRKRKLLDNDSIFNSSIKKRVTDSRSAGALGSTVFP